MRLTPIEQGEMSSAEVMERVQIRLHGAQDKRTLISVRERSRRQDLCHGAIKQRGSPARASQSVGVSLAQWHYWQHGLRPVPDKHLERLEQVAKGEAK